MLRAGGGRYVQKNMVQMKPKRDGAVKKKKKKTDTHCHSKMPKATRTHANLKERNKQTGCNRKNNNAKKGTMKTKICACPTVNRTMY